MKEKSTIEKHISEVMKKIYIAPIADIVRVAGGEFMQTEAGVEIGSGTVPTSEFDAKKTGGDDFSNPFENDFDEVFENITNDKNDLTM